MQIEEMISSAYTTHIIKDRYSGLCPYKPTRIMKSWPKWISIPTDIGARLLDIMESLVSKGLSEGNIEDDILNEALQVIDLQITGLSANSRHIDIIKDLKCWRACWVNHKAVIASRIHVRQE
jgi:hypothetical protein